jgi:deoxyribodipyrimidine photolyase-related protein
VSAAQAARPATPTGFVVLGNQLFPVGLLRPYAGAPVFMAEDAGLCTYVRHHQQKIVLFLAAMRAYRDELMAQGFDVRYEALNPDDVMITQGYEERLLAWMQSRGVRALRMWEIEDKFFEHRLLQLAEANGFEIEFLPSPMFLTTRAQFSEWSAGKRLHMADFYRWQRQRLGVLVEGNGRPSGGQWSFDEENRKPLPRKQAIPPLRTAAPTPHVQAVSALVQRAFASHPGELDGRSWWLPTTREQALAALDDFLEHRLEGFGPFEDALSERDPFLFHSVLTPALNLGLITPAELIERTLARAREREVPLQSVEGFVRQIIGWREFIRGVYRECSEKQERGNFFAHHRQLTRHWYDGTTGLLPLDAVIRKAQRWGWAHHIERLMVVGNLMTLCEIEPSDAHRWFMEMFVDSSDWVMGPNVYGMALFADGGVFATKPYLCASNYLRKMGDYDAPRAGETDWCEILDGLYWRFIDKHREFFAKQARLGRSVALLDRMAAERRERIFAAAEGFLERVTRAATPFARPGPRRSDRQRI